MERRGTQAGKLTGKTTKLRKVSEEGSQTLPRREERGEGRGGEKREERTGEGAGNLGGRAQRERPAPRSFLPGLPLPAATLRNPPRTWRCRAGSGQGWGWGCPPRAPAFLCGVPHPPPAAPPTPLSRLLTSRPGRRDRRKRGTWGGGSAPPGGRREGAQSQLRASKQSGSFASRPCPSVRPAASAR